jgi:hypothetical protein
MRFFSVLLLDLYGNVSLDPVFCFWISLIFHGLFLLLPSTICRVALSASILRRQTGQILIKARPVESFCTFSGSVASILFSMGSVA